MNFKAHNLLIQVISAYPVLFASNAPTLDLALDCNQFSAFRR
jgi:hypothetical protein